jgi:hypothetical protein
MGHVFGCVLWHRDTWASHLVVFSAHMHMGQPAGCVLWHTDTWASHLVVFFGIQTHGPASWLCSAHIHMGQPAGCVLWHTDTWASHLVMFFGIQTHGPASWLCYLANRHMGQPSGCVIWHTDTWASHLVVCSLAYRHMGQPAGCVLCTHAHGPAIWLCSLTHRHADHSPIFVHNWLSDEGLLTNTVLCVGIPVACINSVLNLLTMLKIKRDSVTRY